MMADDAVSRDGHAAHRELAPDRRLAANRLGLWLFLASEGFLFSAIISSRFYLVGLDRPKELNQAFGLALTAVLLASSYTAWSAEVAVRAGNRKRMLSNLGATMALGLSFLGGVVWEWREGLVHFPPSTRFGSAFFTLIGFHAFHLVTGLIVLAFMYRMGRDGKFGPANTWPVEAAVKYWAFVELAWVFIFPTIYLVR